MRSELLMEEERILSAYTGKLEGLILYLKQFDDLAKNIGNFPEMVKAIT